MCAVMSLSLVFTSFAYAECVWLCMKVVLKLYVCMRCMCDACMLLTGPFACLPSSTGLQGRRLTGRPASAAP